MSIFDRRKKDKNQYVRSPNDYFNPAYSYYDTRNEESAGLLGRIKSRYEGSWIDKHLSTVIVLALCVFLLGGTYAYLVATTDSSTNVFTFGGTTPEITEDFDPWEVKKVQITNKKQDDAVPGVVRVLLIPELKYQNGSAGLLDDSGELYDPSTTATPNKLIMGELTLNLDTNWQNNWFYKDGYFYYKKVLNPGETTQPLLQNVTLTNDTAELREKYESVRVVVNVKADIIQAESSAPAEWGVKVDGSNNVSII